MGMYLNPGNAGFAEILRSGYVDKTGLAGEVNEAIGTSRKLICVSRPRRFGKSYAAQMLCAYYDRTCDSSSLFEGLAIAARKSYEEHLNKYDVVYWDMTNIFANTPAEKFAEFITATLTEEMLEACPGLKVGQSLDQTMLNYVAQRGNKFIVIIDEWDAPVRENPEIEKEYLRFLRKLFKSSGTTARLFAAVYMTGILPIRRDGSQSAISDFREYTMIEPYQLGEYLGFTETEVRKLCQEHKADFEQIKKWYDGYSVEGVGSIYNPNSVMLALDNSKIRSYWTETSAASSLMDYISKDYNGLTKTVAELLAGMEVRVDVAGFANDLTTFRGRDDVLTLLVHIGYLTYNHERQMAWLPNEEIKREFQKSIRLVKHPATLQRLAESDQLFLDTIEGREEAVAAQIEKIHAEESSPLHYNSEACLRSVIKLAYYTYRDNYLQWEELPAGVGYADIVYLPKRDSLWPVLVIELKWNKSAQGAIEQIQKKEYPRGLEGYGQDIILVGVNYDKEAPAGERRHQCRIVRIKS